MSKLKAIVLRLQEVDLVFSYFLSHFILFSIYFFLFLELRVIVGNNITQSHISYIR